jgi:RNA polymerase sigma-70 factor (ECF subfamily)
MAQEVETDGDEEGRWMAEFVQTRSRALFDRLYQRYRNRMVAYAMRYVRDLSRAEELAQDVFVRVYRTKSYSPDAPFRAWLYRVATNLCLNEVRKQEYGVTKHTWEPGTAVGAGAEDPEDHLLGSELSERLTRRLQALPSKQRAAFVMARFEGLSHEQIARALDTSVSATKSLIHRALEALRAEVREPPSRAAGGAA